jgi:hypothetical protein
MRTSARCVHLAESRPPTHCWEERLVPVDPNPQSPHAPLPHHHALLPHFLILKFSTSIVSGAGTTAATGVSGRGGAAAAAEAAEGFDEHICPLRLRNKGHEPNLVLKDNDLNFKLRLQRRQAHAVCNQLLSDSEFLRSMEIMDYSLLLGILNYLSVLIIILR